MIIQAWPFNDGGDEKTLLMLKLQPNCTFKGHCSPIVPLKDSKLYLQNITAKT